MADVMRNLQAAMRQLMRSWTFTFAVVLTLALGIGLNAAIFTMVDCVLLGPLGYRDADRIYSLNTHPLNEYRSIAKMKGHALRLQGSRTPGLSSALDFDNLDPVGDGKLRWKPHGLCLSYNITRWFSIRRKLSKR